MTRSGTAGFTLIEVLIAVVVLAVALGASLEALSGFSGNQARLQERYCAHLVAWEDAARYYLEGVDESQPQAGFSEQCGVDWEIDATETELFSHASIEDEGEEDEGGNRIQRLPVVVSVRRVQVYSPAAADAKNRATAELRLLSLRLRSE